MEMDQPNGSDDVELCEANEPYIAVQESTSHWLSIKNFLRKNRKFSSIITCLLIGWISTVIIFGIFYWNIRYYGFLARANQFFPNSEDKGKHIVETVNRKDIGWKARYVPGDFTQAFPNDNLYVVNYPLSSWLTIEDVKELVTPERALWFAHTVINDNTEIPESFDARRKWPHCWTIGDVIDQGICGSCYAVSTVGMISDRTCIHSNGSINVQLSAEHATRCCALCRRFGANNFNGCHGGWSDIPLYEWVKNGLVTGGGYGSAAGCLPYSHHSECGHPCALHFVSDSGSCDGSDCHPSYAKLFDADRHKGSWYISENNPSSPDISYRPAPYRKTRKIFDLANVTLPHYFGSGFHPVDQNGYNDFLKRELMRHGPFVLSMQTFEDFHYYASGVYKHKVGERVSGHAIRVIGWGVENKLPYWLVVNSFGRNWGDNGLGKLYMNDDSFMEYAIAFL